MNKPLFNSALFAFGAILIFGACKKTITTPSEDTSINTVSYYARAVNINQFAVTNIKDGLKVNAASLVTWNTASVYVEDISFEGTGIANAPVNAKILIQKNINILGDVPAGNVTVAVGQYNNAKVCLHLKKSEKSDLAFNIIAKYTDSKGNLIPLVIANSDEFDVKLAVNNITVNAGAAHKVVVSYDMNKLLAGITATDLDATYRSPDAGTIIISSSVNTGLYAKIKANWQGLATATFQ